ncbi:MAG: homogentisate 1,2-dioxygenase [Crocinitomicaceae bacterium]|nr:homogentisate 1,2-dioxygenase [Crocinitomicaceae bacterium]|tara:strand:- start:12225 stop:13382 length:1158 start_codon:yes stop_codon:yes gene_type:complete
MPFYHKLGKFPNKRHITYRKDNGELYSEELFGTIGFDGMSSIMYHCHRPTIVKNIGAEKDVNPVAAVAKNIRAQRFRGFEVNPVADQLDARIPVLFNGDVSIQLASPTNKSEDYFYKNGDADEVIFVHKGSGKLRTQMGNIDFAYGDYLVVPRGMIYKMDFDSSENRLFITESNRPVYTPKKYRNWFGQHLEHSPFCERDLRPPSELETHDELGDFLVKVKREGVIYDFTYGAHPFGVVGWDGYNFPYAFSIHEFEPITGRVHLPPPIHQTFETDAFVICSFVPRLYDYHPQAIPAPYNHSNIDADEVLYYVDGDFMSRNDIAPGHITLHPAGTAHGPHPGAAERSIGKKETEELAVMVDTFRPLQITEQAIAISDKDYFKSWIG